MTFFIAGLRAFMNGWLIAAGFFTLIFLAFLSGTIYALLSRRWPKTIGTITKSGLREVQSTTSDSQNATTSYVPDVHYTYEVKGKTQTSSQIAIGVVTGSQAAAEKICARYPKGAEVAVFHHPKRHELAVLEPGKFVLPLMATLATLPVAYIVVALWISKSLHPPVGPWDRARKAAAERKAAPQP